MEGAATVMPETCMNLLDDMQRRHRGETQRLKLSNSGNFSDIVKKRSRSRNGGKFCNNCSGDCGEDRGDKGKGNIESMEIDIPNRDFYPVRRLVRSVSTPIGWQNSLFCTCSAEKFWSELISTSKSKPNVSEQLNTKADDNSNTATVSSNNAEGLIVRNSSQDDRKSDKVPQMSMAAAPVLLPSIPPLHPSSKPANTPAPVSQQIDKSKVQQAGEKCSRRSKGICRANSESLGLMLTDPCPPHGCMSVKGRRREMEDAVSTVPSFYSFTKNNPSSAATAVLQNGLSGLSNALHFFGVYDGHGGSQASVYCKDRFHEVLAEELNKNQSFNREESDWKKVMSECFKKIDIAVGGICPNESCTVGDPQKVNECCQDPVAPENVGSTAVIAVVSSTQIVVANCGDSRAVLSRGGKVIPLTIDHKPDREDELNRIEAAGGRVIYWNGYRVGGFLAMSRAIGDRFLKNYVISEPEVTCIERTEEDECLVLASDGLWDVLSNEIVCEVARKCLAGFRPHRSKGITEDNPVNSAAALLTKLALSKGSGDNISVVVVDLKERRNRNR